MGIGYILAGLFFLFEPFFNVFDIIPDFIGYLLILRGMTKFADTEEKLAQSRVKMRYALYVALGRYAVMLFSIIANFDSTMKLTFVFALAVLDIFFTLPALTSFFDGLSYSQFRESDRAESQKLANAQKMTAVFIIARAVGAVVPELTALVTDYGYVTSGGTGSTKALENLLSVICFVAVLVLGIVWLSAVVPALTEVKKNRSFLDAVEKKYISDVLNNKALRIKRSVKGFWHIWFAAFFFLLCISLEYHFIIPEFGFGICTFFAFGKARTYDEERKKTNVLCFANAILMLLGYIFLWIYSSNMGEIIFPYESEGFLKYYLPYVIFLAAGYAAALLLCRKACLIMKKMTRDGIGYGESTDARRKEVDSQLRAEACKRIDRLFVMECISVAASAVLMALVPWFSLVWAVRTLLDVIVIIYMYSVMSDISAEAEKVL